MLRIQLIYSTKQWTYENSKINIEYIQIQFNFKSNKKKSYRINYVLIYKNIFKKKINKQKYLSNRQYNFYLIEF